MKVIPKVLDRETDGVYFVDIANYYVRGLVWYVRVVCAAKDPCKKCDLARLTECCCACGGSESRNVCCKCVHEGDVLIAPGYERRVYLVVNEGKDGRQHLRSKLATQKDLDHDRQLHRIGPGVYLYRGYWINDLGYYEPDKRVVWEATEVNNIAPEGAAHGFTLGMCLQELKWSLGEGETPCRGVRRLLPVPDKCVCHFNGKEWVGY